MYDKYMIAFEVEKAVMTEPIENIKYIKSLEFIVIVLTAKHIGFL